MLDPLPEPLSVNLGLPPDPRLETAAPVAPAEHVSRKTLPIERLGALLEVVLCSGLPTQLLVVAALTGLGLTPRLEGGGWSPLFVALMSLIDMVLVIGLVCMFLRAHGESLREFVLGRRRPLREAAIGLLLIPAALMLVVLVLVVILSIRPELHNVPVNPFVSLLQTPRDAVVFAFVVMFAGGVREEIQRGFIIRRFDHYLGGGLLGIVIYSGLFGLGHIDQGYAAALATGVLGAAWGLLYWSRGSIIAPMVSHAGFNLAQLLKYLAVAWR